MGIWTGIDIFKEEKKGIRKRVWYLIHSNASHIYLDRISDTYSIFGGWKKGDRDIINCKREEK